MQKLVLDNLECVGVSWFSSHLFRKKRPSYSFLQTLYLKVPSTTRKPYYALSGHGTSPKSGIAQRFLLFAYLLGITYILLVNYLRFRMFL